MVGVLVSAALAAALAVAAALKASRPREALAGLAALGLPGGGALLSAAVAVELSLALGVAAGSAFAAYAAAGCMAAMSAVVGVALARGRGGEPCPCFGGRGAIGGGALLRNALLAAGFLALPALAHGPRSWIPVATVVGAAASAVALARRPLRGVPADGALEVADEGPPLGARLGLVERFDRTRDLAVAVFGSSRCALCGEVAPAVERLREHPHVSVVELDEERDADAWRELAVPGAPYAVALSPDGVVAAKGTFNTGRQLDGILATAERRLAPDACPRTSRRGFLVGAARLAATVGAGALVAGRAADDADAYHFCGHIYTTGSCPHPTGLPRTDAQGFPLRASDGEPVDDLGRPIDANGRPVDDHGRVLRDPSGRPLPAAPRTRICDAAGERYGIATRTDGSWYRCCGGRVRRLSDCCSPSRRRINGDAALVGYCRGGRRVFCVQYYDTSVPC